MFREYFEIVFTLVLVGVVFVRCVIVGLFLIYNYRYVACLGGDKYLLLLPEIAPAKKLAEAEDRLLKRTALGIKVYRVLLFVLAVFIVIKKWRFL